MEHKVRVCANSGAWGIHSINLSVDLGNSCNMDERKSLEDIREAIMTASLMAGYPSILHYESIDGIKTAVAFLRLDSQLLADDYVKRLNQITRLREEVEETKARDDEWAKKYGADRIAFLERTIEDNKRFFGNAWRAFELLGIDINERGKIHRICENLGMYRV